MSFYPVDLSPRKWNDSDSCTEHWFQTIRRDKTKSGNQKRHSYNTTLWSLVLKYEVSFKSLHEYWQTQYHFFSLHPISKLDDWLNNIQADRNSIQAIHKLRNSFEDGSFKETYTGFLSLKVVHKKIDQIKIFLVLNHISAENISPSGVLSITPNEEMKRKRSQVSIQTMNLLKMKVKVLIYTSTQ